MTKVLYLLQFISLIGLFLIPKKYLKVNIYFCPVFVIGAVFVVLLFAGYADFLYEASCVLYGLGFLSIVINRKELFDKKTIIALGIYCSAITALYVFKLRYLSIEGWDDFVVWGSRVKAMLMDNALPDAEDVSFVVAISYGEGTGLWIYYFCRFIKNSESFYLLGNQIIKLSGVFALIPTIKKINIQKIVIYCLFTVYILTSNNYFNTLIVDGIMSALCLAGISIVLEEKNNKEIVLMFLLVLLSQIKANAIYFVFLVIAAYFLFSKELSYKKRIFNIVVYFVLPYFLVEKTFAAHIAAILNPQSSSSNTTVPAASTSTDNRTKIDLLTRFLPSDKTPQECKEIALNIIKNSLNFKYHRNAGMIAISISFLLILVSSSAKKIKEFIKAELAIILTYAGYILCVIYAYYFMYRLNDAQHLVSFDRYLMTCVCVVVGIGVIYNLKSDNNHVVSAILATVLMLVLSNHNPLTLTIMPELSAPSGYSERVKFKNMMSSIEPDPNNSYLIIDIEWIEDYYCKMGQESFNVYSVNYDLWSTNYAVVEEYVDIPYALSTWELWYDYLIIDTPTNETNEYLESIGRGDLIWQEYTIIKSSKLDEN